MSNLFMSVADQMGATLAQTSWSVNIKERFDFSCAIFDAAGDLVANAPHVPVHLGSMSAAIKTVMRLNPDAQDGDAFMLNAPANGGTHLPDVTVVTPVFVEGQARVLAGLARASCRYRRAHAGQCPARQHAAGGGRRRHRQCATGAAAAGLLESEARAVLASGRYPCRNPDQNMADLKAQVAANETGRRELLRVCAAYGVAMVDGLYGPCAGQRRGKRAPGHRPPDRWRDGLSDGRGPGDPRQGQRRPGKTAAPRSISPAPARSTAATTTRRWRCAGRWCCMSSALWLAVKSR